MTDHPTDTDPAAGAAPAPLDADALLALLGTHDALYRATHETDDESDYIKAEGHYGAWLSRYAYRFAAGCRAAIAEATRLRERADQFAKALEAAEARHNKQLAFECDNRDAWMRSCDAARADNERLRALLNEADDVIRDYAPGFTVLREQIEAALASGASAPATSAPEPRTRLPGDDKLPADVPLLRWPVRDVLTILADFAQARLAQGYDGDRWETLSYAAQAARMHVAAATGGGDAEPTAAAAPPADTIRAFIARHDAELKSNHYAYFELAYTRVTNWMAWLCSNSREDDPGRRVIARGQGLTPDEACEAALQYARASVRPPRAASDDAPQGTGEGSAT